MLLIPSHLDDFHYLLNSIALLTFGRYLNPPVVGPAQGLNIDVDRNIEIFYVWHTAIQKNSVWHIFVT